MKSKSQTIGKNHAVTILDVARESGFSPTTVSIALNGVSPCENLRAETRRRIFETAQRLGYRPSESAQVLRRGRSNSIGIVVFDIADPFCTVILRGIDIELKKTGYLPIVMDAHNSVDRFKQYVEMLVHRRVEGLIVVANWLFIKLDALKSAVARNLPAVVVGRDMHRSGISSVLVDNELGGYLALRHIYELGHRKIGFLLGPKQLGDSNPRWAGTRRFALEAGLALNKSRIKRLPDLSDPLSGFSAGRELTLELLRSRPEVTAVVAFDDLSAFGAIRALSESGRNVPNDCSVIGFDDVPMSALTTPGLTTIRQPMLEMGSFAFESVLLRIRKTDSVKRVTGARTKLMVPELMVRGSTRKHSS
ncbi:MAG: LacI family DNA-binding transcriptional regulator [Acidobacteriaceae bacterium]